ncbi:MAG: DUF2889 domain-containing protein [Proteobacteria bacterium]|nr:DUF2889 domain-containing protein [Pseudomonadota bacterium]
MPLPIQDVERELTHTRRVRFEGYKRADGLWDIEGHLTDVKNHDFTLQTGVRRAGLPVHDMWVRLTIDTQFNVVNAVAVSDAVPYPGGCESIVPEYAKLVGLNLAHGFRKHVRERLGGVHGCTHITELLGFFPTAAIQTFAGERRQAPDDGRKPFQIDQCHALDSGSETVRRMYPKWYRKKTAENVQG